MTKFNPDTDYSNVVDNPTKEDLARVITDRWPEFDGEKIAALVFDEAAARDAKLTRTYTIPSYIAVEHAPSLTPGKRTVLAYIRKTLIDFRTPSALNFDDTGPTYKRVKLSGYMDREHTRKVDVQVTKCEGCFMTIPANTECPLCGD